MWQYYSIIAVLFLIPQQFVRKNYLNKNIMDPNTAHFFLCIGLLLGSIIILILKNPKKTFKKIEKIKKYNALIMILCGISASIAIYLITISFGIVSNIGYANVMRSGLLVLSTFFISLYVYNLKMNLHAFGAIGLILMGVCILTKFN